MRLFKNRKTSDGGRWALLSWREILDPQTGEPYLTRFNVIATPLFSIKLHWIHKPDSDRALHDHPWPFVSFVLSGGYHEEVARPWGSYATLGASDVRTIDCFSYHRSTDAHRIIQLDKVPTLTLVITGPRVRNWYFWPMKDVHIPHKQYLADLPTSVLVWQLRAYKRFGNKDPHSWDFKCPSCGQVQNGYDFREAFQENKWDFIDQVLGFSCIGNWQKHLGPVVGKGWPTQGFGCTYSPATHKNINPVKLCVGGHEDVRKTFEFSDD